MDAFGKVPTADFVSSLTYRPWAMDPSVTADLEAPKDPGAFKPHASVTDNEILGKSDLQALQCPTKVPRDIHNGPLLHYFCPFFDWRIQMYSGPMCYL